LSRVRTGKKMRMSNSIWEKPQTVAEPGQTPGGYWEKKGRGRGHHLPMGGDL